MGKITIKLVGVTCFKLVAKYKQTFLNLDLSNSTIILETFAANSLNAFQIIK